MPISVKAVGSYVDMTAGTVTTPIPGSPAAGDRMILFCANKDYADAFTVAPSGWTAIGSEYADGTVSAGNGSGSVRVQAWYRDWVSGDADPSVTPVNSSDGGTSIIYLLEKGSGEVWDTPLTTNAAWTLNTAATIKTVSAVSSLAVPSGAIVMALFGIRDDNAGPTWGADGIDAASGITWNGNYVENPATYYSDGTASDLSCDLGYRLVTTGGTVTLRLTSTLATAETGAIKFVVQGLVPSATPDSSEILRPIAGLAEWSGSDWSYIDDVVTQPTSPGDGVFAEFWNVGDVYVDAKYQVEAPEAGTLILGAKLWVLAHTEVAGTVRIEQVRIKISGTWYDLGIVDDYLTESPVWYSYTLVGIAESSDSTDIGFEVKIHDEFWAGDKALIDVAYLEVSYPPTDHSGYGSVSGTDEFYGVGGRTFEGYGSLSGTGEFSGIGTQPARGYGWVIGTDDFSGVGRVPDSGYGPVTGTGYFYGVGRLPDSGYGSVSGAGVLSGTGSVPASSAVVRLRRAGIMGEW